MSTAITTVEAALKRGAAIRTDQAGTATFPEFMATIWTAGVLAYDVGLATSTCTHHGADSAGYVESFDPVAT
jgi:uncharacterized protein YbcV (DUF1398 family)